MNGSINRTNLSFRDVIPKETNCSPLDEIRKDPDALYALIKMISKEKEAANSEDERSSEASITKDPYYPYNQEWFGHDEEDADDLAKD